MNTLGEGTSHSTWTTEWRFVSRPVFYFPTVKILIQCFSPTGQTRGRTDENKRTRVLSVSGTTLNGTPLWVYRSLTTEVGCRSLLNSGRVSVYPFEPVRGRRSPPNSATDGVPYGTDVGTLTRTRFPWFFSRGSKG